MSGTPDLSIVMPLFDTGSCVAEAIDSLLRGADRLLEVIVIDDGSTDNGPEIARSFGAPVRVITQEQRGPAAARNVGARLARGDLLGFLDADDVWCAGIPDPRLAILDSDPHVSVVLGRTQFYIPRDDGERTPYLQPFHGAEAGAMIMRRQVMVDSGGYDESFVHAEDMDFVLRLRDMGVSLIEIPDICQHARLRQGSLCRDIDAVNAGRLRAVRAAMVRRSSAEAVEADP